MLTEIINLSLGNRFLVIVLFLLMALGGAYCALHIPIDAVPDMTNTQVIVLTEAPGLSPLEMEQYVTNRVDIAPQLRQVQGVIEINSIGGFYKTFEVQIDPNRMTALRVSLEEVLKALERNNANTGGGYIVHEGEQRFIRAAAMLHGIEDIEK